MGGTLYSHALAPKRVAVPGTVDERQSLFVAEHDVQLVRCPRLVDPHGDQAERAGARWRGRRYNMPASLAQPGRTIVLRPEPIMPTVAILAFPGVQALDVMGPLDVFAEANKFLEPPHRYRLTVLGTEPGALVCSNGALLQPHACYRDIDEAPDLLFVPGGRGVSSQPRNDDLSDWLRRMGERTGRVASVCGGAFLLAHAGLLDHRRATTHWNDVPNLSARFPLVAVQPDRIFVRDGPVYTSAGVTAGIDLALHLVYEDHGADVSLNVAKRLVVFTQRSGGQSQFSPYLTPYVGDDTVLRTVQDHVLAHLHAPLTVADLARVAAQSERHFARQFARAAGVTPAEFVERARVDAARALLERSDLPLKTVAHRCGFGAPARMRAAFVRHLGVSAGDYRQHFGAFRQPEDS
jgi:transcriptional regulator GlxA family with amidase domain